MFWFSVLRKNGVMEVKRLWRIGDDAVAAKSSSVQELFGPFEAPSYPQAFLKSRLICNAVGFYIDINGRLHKV